MTFEDRKKRIGWLASECGMEESHISQLKKELRGRIDRRNRMWKEVERLTKLEKEGSATTTEAKK